MKMNYRLGAAILPFALLGAGMSSAASLDFLGLISEVQTGSGKNKVTTVTYTEDAKRVLLTCSLGCEGLNSSAMTNSAVKPADPALPLESTATGFVTGHSDLFSTKNSGDAAERKFVNAVTGENYASGIKDDSPALSFVTSALYILFKIGNDPNVTIVKNTGGLNNEFTFAQVDQGSGFSHYTEFGRFGGGGGGGPNPVPLPAGFALLLTGLGAVGLLGRRKAKKA